MTRTSLSARATGVVALGLAALGLAVGCKPPPPAQTPPPPPLVTVARPAMLPVQNYYDYNGYLEAVEMVEIRARVKGYLEKVHFKEGDEVKVGAPLYEIDPREYQSGVAKSKADIARSVADAASADAQVELAKAELNRLESLGPSAARSELDKARATLAANKAAVEVAAANKRSAEAALRTAELQLGYTDLKAPITGHISRTLVTPGNLVGQTDATLLTTIVSTDPVYVYFDAPEQDQAYFQGTQASRRVLVGVATDGGFPHAGELDFVENKVESSTGTLRIRGRLPNPRLPDPAVSAVVGVGGVVAAGGQTFQPDQGLFALVGAAPLPGWKDPTARVLYPGRFARVRVPVGPQIPRPVIPEEALMTGQEGRFVYVLGAENKVTKRTVKVGATVWRAPPADDKAPRWQLIDTIPDKEDKLSPPGAVRSVVAIEDGLTAEDVVIVNGLQKVRPGAPVAPDERHFRAPAAAK